MGREGLLTSPSSDGLGKLISSVVPKKKKELPEASGQYSPLKAVTDGPGRQVSLVASYEVDESQNIQLQGNKPPQSQIPPGPPLGPRPAAKGSRGRTATVATRPSPGRCPPAPPAPPARPIRALWIP